MAEAQVTATMAADDSYGLEVRRLFDTPREQVFEAFTNPDIFRKWWGPAGVHVPVLDMDVRVGGRFSLEMHGERDGNVHHLSGEYKVVDPPKTLAYSWQWGVGADKGAVTSVTLRFNDLGGTTELVLIHEGFADESIRANHESGWCSSFDCLQGTLQEGA